MGARPSDHGDRDWDGCGEKTGARPRAVGWRSSFTNVPRESRPHGLCNRLFKLNQVSEKYCRIAAQRDRVLVFIQFA